MFWKILLVALLAFGFLGCGGAVERGSLGESARFGDKPDVSVAPTPTSPVDGEPLPSPPVFKGCDSKSCEKEPPPALDATFCDPWHSGTGTATEPVWFVGYRGCCGAFPQAKLAPGMLIKGSLPFIYYFGSNGKRYVFPTHLELISWYGPFIDTPHGKLPSPGDSTWMKGEKMCGQVYQFSDAAIGAIPIGGNVTFRPGVFVTGLPSDSKHWAVGQGRMLRLLTTKEVELAVYGEEGVDMITIRRPDGIFINYNSGSEIMSAGDYDPKKEWDTTIESELGIAP
ncbi:hypothetical protein EPN90_01565 [Patescibacteria group bacterium]|nr:MAG: hypothetical protein EPN90_01565 [Patescibacteria group bacterium]